MPVYARKELRRTLGTARMRECIVGTTSMSLGANAAFGVMDGLLLANTDFTGQSLYQRAWVRVGSADYRVGSYNAGSGALVGGQLLRNPIASGADFEVHERVSAAELDACIDACILDLRVEREVALPTIDGAMYYTLDAAASPNRLVDYGEVYYFANPASSLNRDRRDLTQAQVVSTATGMELRMPFALGGSQQIVLDGFLQLTLGSDDAATINIPDRDWLLWGAAARAYDLLIQRTPSQDATLLKERRLEAAQSFTKKSQRWQPGFERKISFDAPLSGNVSPWGQSGDPLSESF